MYGHLAGFPGPKATRVGRLARWLLEASFEDKHCPSWRCYGSDPPFSSLASQIYTAQSTLGSRFIQKVRESFKGREIWGDGGYKSQMRMSLWTPEVSRLGSGLREGDQDSVGMGCGRRQRSGAGDNLSGAC